MTSATADSRSVAAAMHLAPDGAVQLSGVLGDALTANHVGRLNHFITDKHSPAIALFDPDVVARNDEGDWYGEHAGKWLIAATHASIRCGDDALLERVRRVADHLVSLQDADGYLGNYAPERRFMRPQPPKPATWDGAPAERTWDVWTHSYLILGLIEVCRATGDRKYLDAAKRIGDLCWRTLGEDGIDITDLGRHFGLSATILLDPAVELYLATGEKRYLDLARLIVEQAEGEPRNALFSNALAGVDPAEIATGKVYQLLWNMVGIAKLYRVTGNADYLKAVHNLWVAVKANHLTLGGGPWGGVAHRSREVFNPADLFSPDGYVETCSTMAWLQLNRELFRILGEPQFVQEIERLAYNDLLGAQAPNGEDWCYYSFPNGRRTHTTYWRCCKSSGAMALEELPAVAYSINETGGLSVNLLGPSSARLHLATGHTVSIRQETDYPFSGKIALNVEPDTPSEFALRVRVPDWAVGATLTIAGETRSLTAGTYAIVCRRWASGDMVELDLPLRPVLHEAVARNIQESLAPGGESIEQEVMRYDYIAMTYGPLVYSTGLIDGYKVSETVRFTGKPLIGVEGSKLTLYPDGRAPIEFNPYFSINDRRDNSWRLTWLNLAPPDVGV